LHAHLVFDAQNPILPVGLEALLTEAKARVVQMRTPIGRAADGGSRWAKDKEIHLVFRDSSYLPGRALATELIAPPKITWDDEKSVVNVALANMLSSRSAEFRKYSLAALNQFAQRFENGYQFESEKAPPQLTSAYAMLAQIVSPDRRSVWLDEVERNFNYSDWSMSENDDDDSRRTNAFCSLALALSEDPVKQAIGAMLDARLEVNQQKKPGLTVLENCRNQIFAPKNLRSVGIFNSPFRIVSIQPCTAKLNEGRLQLSPIDLQVFEIAQFLVPEKCGPAQDPMTQEQSLYLGLSNWRFEAPAYKPVTVNLSFAPCTSLDLRLETYAESRKSN
jgi:hypothetical protein